ncbi:ephrin-A3-like protein [Lates japonicus]|uniref:Ephrin-A3-like protein n=1 Tax=Lates japonicus TaxID=270547 RepID=A0AAD3NKP0_LATJO|nr:ephrin-A3-like protein [Lates japonicus]
MYSAQASFPPPAARAYIASDRISFRLNDPARSWLRGERQECRLSFPAPFSALATGHFSERMLRREGYTVQVSVNDYLDIYCPHYNTSQRGTLERVVAEQYILYMVNYRGYRTCDPQLGFKRWECNRPHAPHAPIKFSEKFQRYSAFSLGYEFNVGQEYYYISTPTHHHGHSCLRLRVYVCCSTVSQADDDSETERGGFEPSAGTFRENEKVERAKETEGGKGREAGGGGEDKGNLTPKFPKLEKKCHDSNHHVTAFFSLWRCCSCLTDALSSDI